MIDQLHRIRQIVFKKISGFKISFSLWFINNNYKLPYNANILEKDRPQAIAYLLQSHSQGKMLKIFILIILITLLPIKIDYITENDNTISHISIASGFKLLQASVRTVFRISLALIFLPHLGYCMHKSGHKTLILFFLLMRHIFLIRFDNNINNIQNLYSALYNL